MYVFTVYGLFEVVEHYMVIYYCYNIEYFGKGGKVHRVVKWLPYMHAYVYGHKTDYHISYRVIHWSIGRATQRHQRRR
jgi:hypothetical protein